MWMMDDTSHTGMHYRSRGLQRGEAEPLHHHPRAVRHWFSRKVRDAGATLLCETTVTELLRDGQGRVIGVQDRPRTAATMLADVVVLAEGVNGLVGQRAGLRERTEAARRRAGGQGNALPAAGTLRKPLQSARRRRRRDRGDGHDHQGHDRHRLPLHQPRIDLGRHRLHGGRFQPNAASRPTACWTRSSASQRRAAARRLRGEGIRRAPDPRGRLQRDAARSSATAGWWSATPRSSSMPCTARAPTWP